MSTDLTHNTPAPPTDRQAAIRDDYHRVVMGIENSLYTVALQLHTAARRGALHHLLAVIPDAERGMLIDRIADLAIRWNNNHADHNDDAREAAEADLYQLCRQTAQVVAVEQARAVIIYQIMSTPLDGAS
jgi:hypothetical protein